MVFVAAAAFTTSFVLPWYVRQAVTDASPQKRIVTVLAHGSDHSGEYLEFRSGGFADHPGPLSMRAESGGSLLSLASPILGSRTRRYVTAGDTSRIRRCMRGQLSGFLGESPSDFGLAYRSVDVDGHPAWEISPDATDRRVWAIHVHGLGSSRQQCLRGIRVFERLGFKSLIPAYRTSVDSKRPFPRSTLGVSEWRDVAAAEDYAIRNGAAAVLYVGWSLGASIVLRTASKTTRIPVMGALLISPALDWPTIITSALAEAGLPSWMRNWVLANFNTVRGRGTPIIRWQEMPATSSANDPTIPTLVLHGTADRSVPVDCSRDYAARHSQKVSYVEFENAHHTLEWNADPERWEKAVEDWCRSISPAHRMQQPIHTLEAK